MIREYRNHFINLYTREKDAIQEQVNDINSRIIEGKIKFQKISSLQRLFKKEFDTTAYQNQISELNNKMYALEVKIKELFDKNFGELGISFQELVNWLQKENIPVVLTEDDKRELLSYNNEIDGKYTDLKQMVLIHKGDFMPKKDTVDSSFVSGKLFERNISFQNSTKTYNIKDFRNTIHFCINGEVGSHMYGNFDTRRYAVIQPLNETIARKIKRFQPVDTYFEKSLELDNGYILCPAGEYDIVKQNNPKSTIISYEGKSVDEYADAFITALGYKRESVGMWSWSSQPGMSLYDVIDSSLIDKYGFVVGYHKDSKECQLEDQQLIVERYEKSFEAMIEMAKEEKLDPYNTYKKVVEIIEDNEETTHDILLSSNFFDTPQEVVGSEVYKTLQSLPNREVIDKDIIVKATISLGEKDQQQEDKLNQLLDEADEKKLPSTDPVFALCKELSQALYNSRNAQIYYFWKRVIEEEVKKYNHDVTNPLRSPSKEKIFAKLTFINKISKDKNFVYYFDKQDEDQLASGGTVK